MVGQKSHRAQHSVLPRSAASIAYWFRRSWCSILKPASASLFVRCCGRVLLLWCFQRKLFLKVSVPKDASQQLLHRQGLCPVDRAKDSYLCLACIDRIRDVPKRYFRLCDISLAVIGLLGHSRRCNREPLQGRVNLQWLCHVIHSAIWSSIFCMSILWR